MANMLPILLLAKMQQDRRIADARRRRAEEDRRARKRREDEAKKKRYGRNVNHSRYSESEYFYKVVSEDEFLTNFFDEVDRKATEIEAKEENADLLEIQDLLKDSLDKFAKVKEKQEELVALGITLSGETFIDAGAVGVETTEGHGFGGIGKYGYNRVEAPVVFNGIRVSREHLANPDVNPYEEEYRETRAAKEDLGAEVQRIEKEIKRKEFFLKISPFGRDKAEDDLRKLNIELINTKRDIQTGDEKKRKMDAYAALTPEQKIKIGEYYDAIQEYKLTGIPISGRIQENINRGQRYFKYEAELQSRWHRAVDQLIESGVFTADDVKKVEERLAAIDLTAEHEDVGIGEMTFRKGRRDYAKMVTYFYQRPQIEEKRKELAEKRAKLAELKTEEKVISETEELADALPSDKTKKTDEEQK